MGRYDVHSKGKGKATRKEYRQNDHTTNPDLTTIKGRQQKTWSSGELRQGRRDDTDERALGALG
jgi:hypothetical protein